MMTAVMWCCVFNPFLRLLILFRTFFTSML